MDLFKDKKNNLGMNFGLSLSVNVVPQKLLKEN